MKILSWNVNGLRSVCRRNFLAWLKQSKADVVCLQEIKAQVQYLPAQAIKPENYFSYFNSGLRPGYAGVAVYTKERPKTVNAILGLERFDKEGRMLQLEYPDLLLINLYMPQGGRKKENMPYKLEVYKRLLHYLEKIKNKKVIVIGDFNIAHFEIDLARPKQNIHNTMFTPEERAQMSKIISLGFVDTFREYHKKGGWYTWWPYFYHARDRNIGWRIDYVFISKPLRRSLNSAFIASDVMGSDHCPYGIEI